MHQRAFLRAYGTGPYGQIHYRVARPTEPRATPVLCMHQSPHSGLVFEPLLAALGTDRIVVAPDTPGFGYSDPPPAPPEIQDYARSMLALLDELGLEETNVMGYHTGSNTAVAMALAAPRRIARVVMVSAPIYTPEEVQVRRQIYGHRDPGDNGRFWEERWRRFRGWWPEAGISTHLLTNFFLESNRNPDYSWWGHRAAFNYDLASALPKMEQPLLILNPEDDLWELTPRAAPFLKNGRIHDLPGWGHGFMHLHTDQVVGILRSFFDE